jgi:RHS repeat-associated protein
MDNEVKGDGNQQDYGMRIYDPRLGRFLSVDPLMKKFPWYTPYQFAGNSPIGNIDLDGLEDYNYNLVLAKNADGEAVLHIQSDGKEEGFLAGLKDLFWMNHGRSESHNLYYEGRLINNFSSFQELKEVSLGKTVAQIKEYISPQIAAANAAAVTSFLIQYAEHYEGPVLPTFSSPFQQRRMLQEASQEEWPVGTPYPMRVPKAASPTTATNTQATRAANGNPAPAQSNTAGTSTNLSQWNGPVDYSGLKQPRKVGPGMETTAAQRQRILEYNKKMNGGVLRSDLDGSALDMPTLTPKGGKANMKQAEVDHRMERTNGGSNSNSNLQVISKEQNLQKESQRRRQ